MTPDLVSAKAGTPQSPISRNGLGGGGNRAHATVLPRLGNHIEKRMMKFVKPIVLLLIISALSACTAQKRMSMEEQQQMENDFEDCMKKPFMYAQFIDCMQGKGYLVETMPKDQQHK